MHSFEMSFIDLFHRSWFQVNIQSSANFDRTTKGNGAKMIVHMHLEWIFVSESLLYLLPSTLEGDHLHDMNNSGGI